MKAIRVYSFGPPEVMKIEEVPNLVAGPGQVVVAVKAAGVNPVDTYIRSGLYRPDLDLPYTPGIDAAGVIVAIGDGVNHRSVGQRVYVAWSLSGTYAEQVLCSEFQTHPLPDAVTFGQGAAIGVPYGAAYRRCSSAQGHRPGNQSWCMAPAAAWGSRRSSSPARQA